ncbi:MAG: methyltransferase domain-containing protein [Promethearchaeota archaeon]
MTFREENINETYALHSQLTIPNLPTPKELIRKIFRELSLPKNSKLYDLGCGDGRVLIIAASEFQLRVIGYEINKSLFQNAKLEIQKLPHQIQKRITLIRGDLFEADLSDADCVYVYSTPNGYKSMKHILVNLKNHAKIVFVRYAPMDQFIKEINAVKIKDLEYQIDNFKFFIQIYEIKKTD